MATNFGQNPFSIFAYPFSGSIVTGSTIEIITFKNVSPFYTSSNQGDLGGIALNYTNLQYSSSASAPGGSSADLIFKVSGPEYLDKRGSEVFRISATGSNNEARIGIGNFSEKGSDPISSVLHVKGETLVDGDFKIKSGSETVSVSKDNLKDLLQGKAVSDSSPEKNAARGGLTQTFAANALVNLADSSTLVKANETGKLELKANNLTLVNVDATDSDEPIVDLGDKPAGKVLVTGSLDVTGSNVTFDVEDLLTLLGNFGQTGSFAVSGSSDFTGDVNMDGAVTVTDLLSVVAGIESTGSTDLSGSLNVEGGTKMTGSLELTGSNVTFDVEDLLILLGNYGQTGSFAVSGSSDFTGDVNMDGAVTVTDLLTVIAGFGATGSVDLSGSLKVEGNTTITGSVTMKDISTQGTSTYFEHSGITTGGTLSLKLGDIEALGSGNGTKLIIDDSNEAVTITGSLDVSGPLTANGITFPQDTNITIQTPDEDSANGHGGDLTIESGDGAGSSGDGGDLIFNAGKASGGGDAGDIIFNTFGTTAGMGTSGSLIINSKNFQIDTDGNLDVAGSEVDFTNLPTSDPGVSGRLYQTASAAVGMTAGYQVVLISA